MKGHVAYCAAPRAGGIFAHYRTLRDSLAPLGWKVRAVSVGRWISGLWQEGFEDMDCVRVAEDTDDPVAVARAFCDWCVREDIHVVFLTGPDYSVPAWNTVRHLPPDIRVISSVHDTTPFSYRSAIVHPERLSALVATSRRQEIELQKMQAVPTDRTRLIPHAVHMDFLAAGRNRSPTGSADALHLGYAGRIVNAQKGVFLLPRLMRRLQDRNVPWTLDIVGAGPDEAALRERLAGQGLEKHVVYHGRQPRPVVAERMAEWDVFLMPSYHEGFGIALIEAMASGAVPVVHRIRDVTDWIVEDGRTGRVLEPDNGRAMADAIAQLHTDRARLREMSRAASQAARERFAPERMGQAYDALFTEVLREPAVHTPLPWDAFEATRFKRSLFNRWAHACVPRAARGRVGHWIRKFTL